MGQLGRKGLAVLTKQANDEEKGSYGISRPLQAVLMLLAISIICTPILTPLLLIAPVIKLQTTINYLSLSTVLESLEIILCVSSGMYYVSTS